MKQKLRIRFFSETRVQLPALLWCLCVGLFMTSPSRAQHQAFASITEESELTLSEKTLQVLYDISKLNPATELPESYRVALLKISTDFPFAQALGTSFNKSAVHTWLQTNPAQLEEIYLLLSAYFNELDSANQPAESQPKTAPARR
jgi:hypothetical protein